MNISSQRLLIPFLVLTSVSLTACPSMPKTIEAQTPTPVTVPVASPVTAPVTAATDSLTQLKTLGESFDASSIKAKMIDKSIGQNAENAVMVLMFDTNGKFVKPASVVPANAVTYYTSPAVYNEFVGNEITAFGIDQAQAAELEEPSPAVNAESELPPAQGIFYFDPYEANRDKTAPATEIQASASKTIDCAPWGCDTGYINKTKNTVTISKSGSSVGIFYLTGNVKVKQRNWWWGKNLGNKDIARGQTGYWDVSGYDQIKAWGGGPFWYSYDVTY